MNLKTFIKKKRLVWHNHFLPSVLAGLIVAVVSFIYQMNVSYLLAFASIGASATILTNSKSHHLTKLRTVIIAYVIAMVLASILYFVNQYIQINMSINIFLLVFFVGMALFLFDSFHPPAITASMSFVLTKVSLINIIYLFVALIVSLIFVRLIAYVFSQHLSVRDFFQEFKKSFDE